MMASSGPDPRLPDRLRGTTMASPSPERPLEEPLSELERRFITEYLSASGADYHTLIMRNDDEARSLMRRAARYASERLGEIEARSEYVHKLHY
jgi:hypothetical protein